MQTIVHDIPNYLITLIEALRGKLRDENFLARHRVRSQDFTRERQLTFPVLMLFVLQQTVKSIQRHLHEFLDNLAQGEIFQPLTSGAVTHARAKLKESAFIELNRDCVLPTIYGSEHPIKRWRGHRLVGIDSSLVRLPASEEVGQTFGWKEASNQHGATGIRYPEARLSVVYDLLNRVGLDARLEPSTMGEVALAIQQLEHLQSGDVEINDRGFTGYVYLASVWQRSRHFIGRCSTGSFLTAQEMFRRNRANQSQVVWLFASPGQKAECRRLGLPLKMRVRFVSLRLPTGDFSSDAQGAAGTGELQRTDRRGHPAGCSGGGAAGQFGERAQRAHSGCPQRAKQIGDTAPPSQPFQFLSCLEGSSPGLAVSGYSSSHGD